ncbi:MAG TPA: hypothetical protein DD640_07825 [Clostridiales bacterium]|nr:hypothetical protein [Clostridiales bacterium]
MLCWFCSIREAESGHAFKYEMHSTVDAKKNESETKVAYNIREIIVPRCMDCHNRHIRVQFTSVLATIVAVILLAAVIASLANWSEVWIWGVGLGLSAGLLAGILAVRYYALKGIRSVRQAKVDFPEAIILREDGFKVGRQPRRLPKNYINDSESIEKDKEQTP